ncbi:hypothetical protein [Streptosporangium sp. NPDC048865]|uniref:hypothetical protein n=1 Tax=Streptosporangium sp. NPDC048865 TaxID=3155766 RepID=UPI003448A1D6
MSAYLHYLAEDLKAMGFPTPAPSHENPAVQVFALDDVHIAVSTETGAITIARLHPGADDIAWNIDWGRRHPVLTGSSTPAWEVHADTDTPASVLLAIVREAHTLRRLAA